MEPAKGEITLLLGKWKDGDPSAFEELIPLVYPHLREVAAAYIRRERNPDVLQATALVHELYLRLLNQKKAAWDDRRHFYTFAAKVMRRILIDHARESQAQMRGGGYDRIPLSDDLVWVNIGSPELLDLDRALDELGALDAYKVQPRRIALLSWLHCRGNSVPDAGIQGHRGPRPEVHEELALPPHPSGHRRGYTLTQRSKPTVGRELRFIEGWL